MSSRIDAETETAPLFLWDERSRKQRGGRGGRGEEGAAPRVGEPTLYRHIDSPGLSTIHMLLSDIGPLYGGGVGGWVRILKYLSFRFMVH